MNHSERASKRNETNEPWREVDPLAWKEAYINHIKKVKMSVPAERLLVIPMLGKQNPVAISKVGEYVFNRGVTGGGDAMRDGDG